MAVYKRVDSLLAATASILFILIAYLIRNRNRQEINLAVVDFKRPPPCVDNVHEAIRLNELLAYTQYSCSSKIRVPDESHSFYVCLDEETKFNSSRNEQFVFVTISNSFDDFEFETELIRLFKNVSGHVFTPKKQREKVALQTKDRLVFYNGIVVPSSSPSSRNEDESDRKYIPVKRLHKSVGFLKRVDVLKLDCTNCWQLTDGPKLLSQLIGERLLDAVKQLHLVIRLEEKLPEDRNENLLYAWYTVLHELYFYANFAAYSAVQLGECGRTIIHCQYKLSFVKIPPGGALKVLAPITGMGFPEEEIDRLNAYVSNGNLSLCISGMEFTKIGSSIWSHCSLRSKSTKRLIYFFTYSSNGSIGFELPSNCRLFLFDPTLSSEECNRLSSGNVRIERLTLADTKSGNSAPGLNGENDWNLSTLDKVIRKMNHSQLHEIDILIIDLNGGEWDLLEQLLSQSLAKVFRQILIKCRIFYGEENENYRQLYSWFLRLEEAGWKLFHSSPYASTSYSCEQNSCYQLGWIRR